MEVSLITYTPQPERTIAVAARGCYSPKNGQELMESMSDERVKSILNTIVSSGHTSTLEHASYTFSISGVSRNLTHQLVRHRHGSYNQQSQRYVKFDEKPVMVKPETIEHNFAASVAFEKATDACFKAYHEMIEAGIPAEDARYVLPSACDTSIVVTMNVRELLHLFSLRCCNRAQWEVRELAWKMLELVRPTAPEIFKDAGPGCVRGHCPEGKMCCGNPYERQKR